MPLLPGEKREDGHSAQYGSEYPGQRQNEPQVVEGSKPNEEVQTISDVAVQRLKIIGAYGFFDDKAFDVSWEKQKRKVGASKSGKCVERAKAEAWEAIGIEGQGVVKGRGWDEAPPRGRAPV